MVIMKLILMVMMRLIAMVNRDINGNDYFEINPYGEINDNINNDTINGNGN